MCYFCGEALPSDRGIGFNETCPDCGKDMHVCANCDFYKTGLHWDCRETIDALVEDKEKRNFCDFFAAAPQYLQNSDGSPSARSKAQSARSAFDSLFKN
ncbi:MAG: hypothetical protein LLF89_02125 [Spirochaetaceae bacterium]|nr:hypothetical protein [Spirochaetaceae bacterium]